MVVTKVMADRRARRWMVTLESSTRGGARLNTAPETSVPERAGRRATPSGLPHDDTHARVLRVALELFAEKGFAATSTREISERLGFTKAALYYHFRTKDELLGALLVPAAEGLERLVEGATPQPATVARRAILSAYVDLVADNAEVIRVLTQDPAVASRPLFQPLKPLFVRLTALLAGVDKPDAVARTRVRAALGGIGAALLHATPRDNAVTVKAATLAAACGALGIAAPR